MIDVLYLCHGRLEFTKASLQNLLANTPWDRVHELVIYNDAAPDHPLTYNWLRNCGLPLDAKVKMRNTNIGSPVGVMNHFLARSQAELFAKIDNDIIVPEGWLDALVSVMERDPDLELLGMEPGMSGLQPTEDSGEVIYSYLPSSHIGGVGIMRRTAFTNRPPPVADGRFGFTEWQHQWEPVRGWIQPDLRMFALDLLPITPWREITSSYREVEGLQRDWPPYDPKMSWYWSWWL